MPFAWTEFLELAKELAGRGGTGSREARERSAISRAYYAAFGEVRGFLHRQSAGGYAARDAHKEVREAIIEFAKRAPDVEIECRHIADNLRRLFRSRVQMDYDVGPPPNDRTLDEAFWLAEEILADLEEVRIEAGDLPASA